ncbi:MAG: pyridoxamine 5'-phosphate oxidase [Bradymonadaceae bacterium]|nr:pyridoxamine 5'-phosphate oxidase [Lujinxingiaceae bacterium]
MPTVPFNDPVLWFDNWFAQAQALPVPEANAMTLATVADDGQPSLRIVLLKDFDRKGFVFYTNGQSRKGYQLAHHPLVALNFYWRELARQVRIEGGVEPVSDEEADAYFASRPRESQLGAWASLQSQPLDSRAALLERLAGFEARFDGQSVPRPAHWGGWRVLPSRFEFWQAGDFRLHDRWEFRPADDQAEGHLWRIQRLFP